MKNLKEKRIRYIWATTLLPSFLFLLMLVCLLIGITKFDKIRKEQNLILTEQAIKKATIQCYANEGMFPSSISYLEENYYLNIDYDTYYIIYDSIASNFMPEIGVFLKK